MDSSGRKEGWRYILHNIAERRSVFPPAFSDEPVSREELELMLEAANWAPTHKLTQPWRFVVLLGQAKQRLADFLVQHYKDHTPEHLRLEKKIQKLGFNPVKSSAIIAICMLRDKAERVPEWEELAATACAVQNLWLAATALGLGGYWSSPSAMEELGDLLGLEDGGRCLGLFYLGHCRFPDAAVKRSPWQDKVRWLRD